MVSTLFCCLSETNSWCIELLKDPLFKRYAAVVDRALAAFDTIVEWPDYIAFLSRLVKVPNVIRREGLIGAGATGISYVSGDSF